MLDHWPLFPHWHLPNHMIKIEHTKQTEKTNVITDYVRLSNKFPTMKIWHYSAICIVLNLDKSSIYHTILYIQIPFFKFKHNSTSLCINSLNNIIMRWNQRFQKLKFWKWN